MKTLLLLTCNSLIELWQDQRNAIITAVVGGLTVAAIVGILKYFLTKNKRKHDTNEWRNYKLNLLRKDFGAYHRDNPIIARSFTFKDKNKNRKYPLSKYFLRKVFKRDNQDDSIYLLLGDAGSGKTTALKHLYIDYINKYTSENKPHDISILSLASNANHNQDVFEKINKIQNKHDHILLLDAMDENLMAQSISTYENFRTDIESLCTNFAYVVIACRQHFFPTEKAETSQFKAKRGEENITFIRLELVPFSDRQTKKYINRYSSLRKGKKKRDKKKRRQAMKLFKNKQLIDLRPMALKNLEAILDNNITNLTTLRLYDAIVKGQMDREFNKPYSNINPKDHEFWWKQTCKVAGVMNRLSKKSLTNEELDRYKIDQIERHQLFLTRDKKNDEYYFSPQRYFEYFLAYYFFLHPEEISPLGASDLILKLFEDMKNEYHNNGNIIFNLNYRITKEIFNKTYDSIKNINKAQSLFSSALSNYNSNSLHYQISERDYTEALSIYRQLSTINSQAFQPEIAKTLNNLAVLHNDIYNHSAAKKEFNESLSIFRQLANINPDIFLPEVANTLSNLAKLHNDMANLFNDSKIYNESEKDYKESLSIRRKLAKKDLGVFDVDVALTLNNLAKLHNDMAVFSDDSEKYNESETEYKESLSIRRELAEHNPKLFPEVANTLNNLAKLHNDMALFYHDNKCFDEAETEYKESLLYGKLLSMKHESFKPLVVRTLSNLAKLHSDMAVFSNISEKYDEAEKDFEKSLSVGHQLSEHQPQIFLPVVASILFNQAQLHIHMASFYHDSKKNYMAEKELTEALSIYRKITEKNPYIFSLQIANTLHQLARIHRDSSNETDLKKSEEEFIEALEISKNICASNPNNLKLQTLVPPILNNYGVLLYKLNRDNEAEQKYIEALNILLDIERIAPDLCQKNIANTLYNIVVLLDRNNTNSDNLILKAINAYRQLAKSEPEVSQPKIAELLVLLANNHYYSRNTISIEEYTEAIEIYRTLSNNSPNYLPHLATSLHNLANAIRQNNPYSLGLEAEKYYREALSIRRKLTKENHYTYCSMMANTLFELASLHYDHLIIQTAHEEYCEVLTIYRQLSKTNPNAFLPRVAESLNNMAWLLLWNSELTKAETAAQESLEIYRTMAEKSPVAFVPKIKMAEKLLAEIQEAAQQHGGD